MVFIKGFKYGEKCKSLDFLGAVCIMYGMFGKCAIQFYDMFNNNYEVLRIISIILVYFVDCMHPYSMC